MARPKKISEDAILKAAREIFVEFGSKATTEQIAKKAGISEGSIFLHFGSKKNFSLLH